MTNARQSAARETAELLAKYCQLSRELLARVCCNGADPEAGDDPQNVRWVVIALHQQQAMLDELIGGKR